MIFCWPAGLFVGNDECVSLMRGRKHLRTSHFGDAARGEPKGTRTRARLMDAAVRVIAERGVNAASANEIAALAEVSNGTFYNHFRDKAEIVTAVVYDVVAAIDRQMNEAHPLYEDGAKRVAFATQKFVRTAVHEPDWGRMLVQLGESVDPTGRQIMSFLRADLKRGIEQGCFTAELSDFLVKAARSIVFAAIRSQLMDAAGPETGVLAAAYLLTLFGIGPKRARQIAERTRPPAVAP